MQTDTNQPDRRILLQNALAAVEKLQAKLDTMERARSEPIAIVGMSCRFPGGANDPEAFWQLLCAGRDAIREVPAERWDVNDYTDSGITATWYGGFLDQVDQFDPGFFGIAPREAESMDPQQRLVLEVSWEALERAGQAPNKLKGSRTGIFIGVTTSDYAQLTRLGGPTHLDVYTATGSALNAAPGRVAYTLGLQGPSIAVDTACSSSLVAVHLACQSLRSGESDMALAGGVNALLTPEPFICFAKWGMMAPDGRCKTFDARADGFVRGEGCGIIVLKRLSDALAAGDNILALIRGSAVNQDGRSSGLTVPNGLAQQAVVRKALANAGLRPAEVSYVETHGTGTSLGDPIEIEALGAALGEGRSDQWPLAIGSVKTNIGHLESASGIAGLIKVVLSLQHQELPPHLHLQERSPRIPWPKFPIAIPTERMAWPAPNGRRIAGVSSFGFSGTNAHVVLEDAPPPAAEPSAIQRPYHILSLSAKNEPALKQLAAELQDHLATHPAASAADVAYTANTGRAHFAHRLAVVAESPQQMSDKLTAWVAGQMPLGAVGGQLQGMDRPRVAFLFTGQGAQYVSMGRQLYETQPTFRGTLERCDEILRPYLKRPLLSVLYAEEGEASPLDETGYTQPALFALEYALATLWRSWGVEPAVVMGHSVGEYVAACVAGVFSLEDGLRLIAERGRLMQALPAGGEMAAVFADEARVAAAVAPYHGQVAIAAINGPENTVISGAGAAIQAILHDLAAAGVKAQRLIVSHAFHSPLMEPMLDAFTQTAVSIAYSEPQIGLISNVTGQLAGPEIATAAYWREHVRASVQFARAMHTLSEQGYRLFLEIGPKPTLLGMGQRCLPAAEGVWLPSLRAGRDDWQQMLDSLGSLYVHGLDIDWTGFDKDYPRRKLSLPTYPFQRQRYWLELPEESLSYRPGRGQRRPIHPLLEQRLHSPLMKETVFESRFSAKSPAFLDDHRIYGTSLFPEMGYLELAMAAGVQLFGAGPHSLEEVVIQEPLILPEEGERTVQVAISPAEAGKTSFQVFSWMEDAGEPWKLHATGTIRVSQSDVAVPTSVPLAEMQARCSEEVSAATYYQQLAELGLAYGTSFRGIARIWRRDGEAVGEITLPPTCVAEAGDYQLHPALLDACFQLLGAAMPGGGKEMGEAAIYVPIGVTSYRVYRPGCNDAWGQATLHMEPGVSSHGALTGDLRLLDAAGQVIAELVGLSLKQVSREMIRQATHQRFDHWLYEVEWRRKEPEIRPASDGNGKREPGNWLIFVDQNGLGETLAMHLQAQGETCVVVRPGATCQMAKPGDWQIDPAHPEDFRRLLDEVAGNTSLPCRGVIHLWSLDVPQETTASALHAAQALTCGSVLNLIQALGMQTETNPDLAKQARLWLVTRGSQPVGTDRKPVAVAQTPLWGLGRTIALEHPELRCVCLDLDPADAADSGPALFQHIWAQDVENQVAFRQNSRYVARLNHRVSEPQKWQPLAIHSDGTYLITGGLGGLGLKVARWLAEQGAQHLVLMGRSGATDIAGKALRELEQAGVQVIVAQSDVSRQEDVARVLVEIEQAMPPLRGVFHAAGVLDDGMLLQQSWHRFETVMAPKIDGAWHLHTLTQDMPLDYFVLFSAGAALLGSPGQGGYAAANAFLDGLAHYRRTLGLPGLSINWGPWAEVGMAAALGGRDRDRWAAQGIELIAPQEGVQTLEQLLRQNAVHVGVLSIVWPKFMKQFSAGDPPPLLFELARTARLPIIEDSPLPERAELVRRLEAASPQERQDLIVTCIQRQVMKVLKLDGAGALDPLQPLNELGLDSLMALELKNRVEADLGVVVPMVQLLQGCTTAQLVVLVSNKLAEAGAVEAVPATAVATTDGQPSGDRPDGENAVQLLATLDQLSDDQVDSLLSDLLAEDESAQ